MALEQRTTQGRQIYAIHQAAPSFQDAAHAAILDTKTALACIAAQLDTPRAPSTHMVEITTSQPGVDAVAPLPDPQQQPFLEALGLSLPSVIFWCGLSRAARVDAPLSAAVEDLYAAMAALVARWNHRKPSPLMAGAAHHFGQSETLLLAYHNQALVPLYAQMLSAWDMSHEGSQGDDIDLLIDRHGPCPQIDALIAARLVDGPGQHGFDQFTRLLPRIADWHGTPSQSAVFDQAALRMQARGVTDLTALRQVFGA